MRSSTKRCEDNELEHSRLTLDCSWSMSDMYWGVWWWMDLKTRTRILKSMRCLIGSKWSSMRSAVTGSYLCFLVTRRAEVRWMFWSRSSIFFKASCFSNIRNWNEHVVRHASAHALPCDWSGCTLATSAVAEWFNRECLPKFVNELAPPTLQTFWHERTTRQRKGDSYFNVFKGHLGPWS